MRNPIIVALDLPTATQALTNVTYPYIELLADLGLEGACRRQPALVGGINVSAGQVNCRAVADAHGMLYVPWAPATPSTGF